MFRKVRPETSAVVAGSFNPRFLRSLKHVIGCAIVDQGFTVLAPDFEGIINPGDDFAVLDTDDPNASPRALEQAFMDKIAAADLLIVTNHYYLRPGRVGLSAAAEMAHAALSGTPISVTFKSKLRDYPDVWFADELASDEQRVLERLPYVTFDPWDMETDWKKRKESARPIAQIAQTSPDYIALDGLRSRLLAGLPDTPSQQHAS